MSNRISFFVSVFRVGDVHDTVLQRDRRAPDQDAPAGAVRVALHLLVQGHHHGAHPLHHAHRAQRNHRLQDLQVQAVQEDF